MQGDKVVDMVRRGGHRAGARPKRQKERTTEELGKSLQEGATVQRPPGTERAGETESRSVWPELGGRGSERRRRDGRGGGPFVSTWL